MSPKEENIFPPEILEVAEAEAEKKKESIMLIHGAIPGWLSKPRGPKIGITTPGEVVLFSNSVPERTVFDTLRKAQRHQGLAKKAREMVLTYLKAGAPSVEVRPWPTKDGVEWFNIAGIGNDGCEMLLSSMDREEVQGKISRMELRARFNGQRNIGLYTWISDRKVTWDDLKTQKQLRPIITGATKIF